MKIIFFKNLLFWTYLVKSGFVKMDWMDLDGSGWIWMDLDGFGWIWF